MREGPAVFDPEEELRKIYSARVTPFRDIGHQEKVAQYEEAWEIARGRLRKVRERNEHHAS
jgi:hypothetical protein